MKIYFFKNENDICERESCLSDIDITVKSFRYPKALYYTVLSLGIVYLIAALFISKLDYHKNVIPLLLIAFSYPVIHEVIHALHCALTGRKIERICIFPYGITSFSKPSAYVMPEFSVWTKYGRLMFVLFPFIFLTVVPIILSFIFPSPLHYFLLLSAFNFLGSSFDICDAVTILKQPKGTLFFRGFIIMPVNSEFVLHRVWISEDKNTVFYKQYIYGKDKLTEVQTPTETEKVKLLIQEFKDQFKI